MAPDTLTSQAKQLGRLEGGLYTQAEVEHYADEGLAPWIITTHWGQRVWWATDSDHAEEQHDEAFGEDPDERLVREPELGEV